MKKPRNYTTLHCRAVSCIAACHNQKPRVSYAVVNFITHTGQINYFSLCIVLGLHIRLHSNFCGASGYGALAILWWQSGRQQVSVGRRSGDPPKTSPFVRFLGRPNMDTRGEELVIVLRLYLKCRFGLPRPSVKLLVSQGAV